MQHGPKHPDSRGQECCPRLQLVKKDFFDSLKPPKIYTNPDFCGILSYLVCLNLQKVQESHGRGGIIKKNTNDTHKWEAKRMARNILVVEDDRNISDLIRMYLEKEGFDVRIISPRPRCR